MWAMRCCAWAPEPGASWLNDLAEPAAAGAAAVRGRECGRRHATRRLARAAAMAAGASQCLDGAPVAARLWLAMPVFPDDCRRLRAARHLDHSRLFVRRTGPRGHRPAALPAPCARL